MPRKFGGNSPLGAELNEIGSRQEGLRVAKSRRKYGIIKEVVGRKANQGVYTVILELIGPDGKSQGTTGPIPLREHPMFLAANYGAPEELVGRYICMIDYMGTSANRGVATIVRPLTSDKEITEQTNQVQITGAAFAPPGSGLI
jgi:hypothetical protein